MFYFLLFCFCFKNRLRSKECEQLRWKYADGGSMHHKAVECGEQSPGDQIDKEEMGNGKKTGAFPSPLCFKLDKCLTPGSRMLL